MTEEKKLYAYSIDEEHYEGSYDTAEEAAADGFADRDYEPNSTVSVGEIVRPSVEELIPSFTDICDSMIERACEIAGDFGDGYLSDAYTQYNKNRAEIEKDYAAAVVAIFEKYGFETEPYFFTVKNVVLIDKLPPIQDERIKPC